MHKDTNKEALQLPLLQAPSVSPSLRFVLVALLNPAACLQEANFHSKDLPPLFFRPGQ